MASKVHRVRFYNPEPQPINCLSFSKTLKQLALARADASIEVWDLRHAPCLVRFIPGVENGSVEALGWVHGRLLSTGTTGALVEWDVAKLTQKNSVLLTGYPAWCLDVDHDETLVAVGTEQGYINLFSVENNNIIYNKLFDKQEGRIMCCKFDKAGKILVTGSLNTIRVWNVDTGHAMTRISVTRRQKEVMVWSVAVLSDNTIVSGDSHGRLTFWDGAIGEQIESYTTQKADILSIAVSDDEQNIYCSGIDPIISHFVKIEKAKDGQATKKWVKHVQRYIHEHDVRALLVTDGKLVSVGVDGYLSFSSYPPKWVMRVPPMIPMPRSSVCARKKLLLLRYSNHLEVWKLGSYAVTETGDLMFTDITTEDSTKEKGKGHIEQDSAVTAVNKLANNKEKQGLKLTEHPTKLTTIHARHKKQIQCCEMSPSGEFIVYATESDIRMVKLDTDDQDDDQTNISLSKVLITGLSGPCQRVAFGADSRRMVARCGAALYILHVDPEAGATVVQTVAGEKVTNISSILHLLVSKKTKAGNVYIVQADVSGLIEVLVEKKKKFVSHITLPKYQCVPTALTVDSERETLIIVYSDQTIIEYDLRKKKVTEWPGAALPPQWRARSTAVEAVGLHPRRRALVCQDLTSLWILDRTEQSQTPVEPVVKRKPNAPKPLAFSVVPIKYLAGFHWLDDDEAVIVEVLPEKIVSQLPAPVQVNRWS